MTDDDAGAARRVARDLASAIDAALPLLGALDERRAGEAITAGKWSRKQVIGHLVDSALNNQQRFVRGQLGSPLVLPGYAQEEWVRVQAHQERSWGDLLTLWTALNRHLVHVLDHLDPRTLETPCTIGSGAPVTLRYLAEDYVVHLRHHLAQVLTPDVLA
jgi:hypothetical protein